MSRLVVCMNLTLDGVMQAPGRPDEDRRGGFAHGGWATPFGAMAQAGDCFARAGALLLGRRTYEDFYSVWPQRTDSPFTPWLNDIRKYVASTTLKEPLPWSHSTLLNGDAAEAVPKLRTEPGKDVLVLGSGQLVQSLMPRNVISAYVLFIHPLVLGSGRRLFLDGSACAAMRLVDSKTTTNGVVVATYEPAERVAGQYT